jgi:hypothetical protein
MDELKEIFLHKLQDTSFFQFSTKHEELRFQQLLIRWQFKDSEEASPSSIVEQALECFVDCTSEQMVNDKCVGCNSFFYRFHPIETVLNPKDVRVEFCYNLNASEEVLLLK